MVKSYLIFFLKANLKPLRVLFLPLLFTLPVCALDSEQASSEIDHLLGFIKISECTFIRNGSRYLGLEAYEHIHKKYEYVLGKGLIDTAEDFIKYSATKSSFSGKAYSVICEAKEISSEQWLKGALHRYRDAK